MNTDITIESLYNYINEINDSNHLKIDKSKLSKLCPDCGDRNIIDDQMRGKCVCGNCYSEIHEYFDN